MSGTDATKGKTDRRSSVAGDQGALSEAVGRDGQLWRWPSQHLPLTVFGLLSPPVFFPPHAHSHGQNLSLSSSEPPPSDHHFLCLDHLLCCPPSILCLFLGLPSAELTPFTVHQSLHLLISLPLPLDSVAGDSYHPFAQAPHPLGPVPLVGLF